MPERTAASSLARSPLPLGDGLVMRPATADDVDELSAFNGQMHRGDELTEPSAWITAWTRDLMTRSHPTFSVGDFLVVEDTGSGRIVSSLNLISQTWSYGGVELGVGRPELVGTDPSYRRRVPDLPAFVRRIGPVLERRLAGSLAPGHTGELKLSFYRSGLRLRFAEGRLAAAESFEPPDDLDAGAWFPDLTFLHLLFGHRSLDELRAAYPDCYTRGDDVPVLLETLFPKKTSCVWAIQ